MLRALKFCDIEADVFTYKIQQIKNKHLLSVQDCASDNIAHMIKFIDSILEKGALETSAPFQQLLSLVVGENKRPSSIPRHIISEIKDISPTHERSYLRNKNKYGKSIAISSKYRKKPDSTKIVFISKHVSGCYGDVSIASKLIAALHDIDESLDIVWIVHSEDITGALESFSIDGTNTLYIDDWDELSTNKLILYSIMKADKLVSIPTAHKLPLDVKVYLERHFNLLSISEYNFNCLDMYQYRMGIGSTRGAQELGIFVSSPPRVLSLPEKVLPKVVYDAFEPAYKDDIRNNRLFFSYTARKEHEEYGAANHALAHLFEIAIRVNPSEDIVIVGRWENVAGVEFERLITIAQHDGSTVKEYSGVEEVSRGGYECLVGKGRTVCLVDPFPLEHSTMKLLQFCANPICQTTGDQSQAEAMSFWKLPMYQCLSWKKYYIDAVIKLLQNKNLHTLSLLYKYGMNILQEDGKFNYDSFVAFVFRNEKVLIADAKELSVIVSRQFNAVGSIAALLNIRRDCSEISRRAVTSLRLYHRGDSRKQLSSMGGQSGISMLKAVKRGRKVTTTQDVAGDRKRFRLRT